MTSGSVNSIETFGLVDGPGIRCVIFMNGCKLRCKFCHNPETWNFDKKNMTSDEVVKKVIRSKPYFKRNNGGVTFSGGEPLLQKDFLIECMEKLKKENIHIALDTAGVGIGDYEKILSLTDLVLLDIKHTDPNGYLELTGQPIDEFNNFLKYLNNSGKKVWIRQVITPGITDTYEYLKSLKEYLKNIKNIERVDFLPYHSMAKEKYKKLGLNYPLENTLDMDKDKCNKLFDEFINM